MLRALIILLLVVLGVILGLHFFIPLVVGAVVITAGVWAFVITSIVVFCAAVLLTFLFTGLGLLIMGGIGLVWVIIGIVFFPFLYPILLPLLILFLFISYMRERELKKK